MRIARKQCLVLSLIPLVLQAHAGNKEETEKQAEADRASLRQFPEARDVMKGVSPVIDKAARQHAIDSARTATDNKARVSSQDRPSNGPLASRAHDRGAVDVVSPNTSSDAAKISKQAGPGYTVIHETPVRPTDGSKRYDKQELYVNGAKTKTIEVPPRATNEHNHLQPEFNKRLHEAVTDPPSKTK